MLSSRQQRSGASRGQSRQKSPEQSHEPWTSKAWSPKFFQNRISFDRSFKETVEEINLERDLIDVLLQHTDSAGPSWEVQEAKKFYSKAIPDRKSYIWTDCCIRNLGSKGCSEGDQHETEWQRMINLTDPIPPPRIQPRNLISTRRNLIFAPDLTPAVLKKLAISATWYQAQSLRHAVRKHVARRTLICVTAPPVEGFPVFRLQMHLPSFMLKESALVDNDRATQGLSKILCSDLVFLPLNTKYTILEAHASVVIYGAHHFDWYGYAFGNIGDQDFSDEYEEAEDAFDVKSEEGTDDYYYSKAEDFFAAGGCQDTSPLARPIMDPRIYFLLALRNRLKILVQAHDYLIQTLSRGFYTWVDQHRTSRRSGQANSDNDLEEALRRIEEMNRLFRYLQEQFSAAIITWKNFNSSRGDILYFSDLRDCNKSATLHKIDESFEVLEDLEDRLNGMLKTCAELTNAFTLHLQIGKRGMNRAMTNATKGSAESAKNSERFAEEAIRANRVNFQLVTFNTAVVIALQYFCSERAVFAFDRNPRTFWISICILVPSLHVLTYALRAADHVKTVLLDRFNGRSEKTMFSQKISLA